MIEMIALLVLILWVGSGLTLAGIIFWKSGFPDYETYDGPAIAWGETIGTVIACVIGSPFWYWLAFKEWRRSPAPVGSMPGEK